MNLKEYLKDRAKYIREPWRLRVHLAYILIAVLALTADPIQIWFEVGAGMIIVGVLIRAWASGIVKKDEELAVTGPYSLARNPLYVGNFLIGYGFALIQGDWWSLAVITIYFASIYPFTIREEESKLSNFFPEQFERYSQEVPRFIPRLTPYKSLSGWNPKQYSVVNKDWLNEVYILLWLAYALMLYLKNLTA